MIRTEKEFKSSLKKLGQNEEALEKQKQHLESMHLSSDQVELAMSPLLSFYHQLREEIEAYEKIKGRDWEFIYKLANFQHVGQLFIALRIAYSLTQRDFAYLLGVSEAQVSKDERNEYHGISLERTIKIMGVLKIAPAHFKVDTQLDRDRLMHG